jgi:hypothetical protein
MCREISHFGKSRIAGSGVLVTRDRDFPWWKPRDRSEPSDLRGPRVMRFPFWEIKKIESPGDERSGLSMVVETDLDCPI